MVSKSPWRVPIIAPPTPTPCLPPKSTQKWHFPPKIAIFDYFKKESWSISAKMALGLWGMVSKSPWRVPIIAPPIPVPCLPPNSTKKWHFPPKIAIFDDYKKESGSISAKNALGLVLKKKSKNLHELYTFFWHTFGHQMSKKSVGGETPIHLWNFKKKIRSPPLRGWILWTPENLESRTKWGLNFLGP